MTKICSKCRKEKDLSEYLKWNNHCQSCRNQYKRNLRQKENPILVKARDRIYYLNKELKNAYQKNKGKERGFTQLRAYLQRTQHYNFTTAFKLLMYNKPILVEKEFEPVIKDLRKYF